MTILTGNAKTGALDNRAIDLSPIFSMDILASTATKLALIGFDAGDRINVTFNGTNVGYTFNGGQIVGITSGLVDNMIATVNGMVVVRMQDMAISAKRMAELAFDGDDVGMSQLLFRADDTLNGTGWGDDLAGFAGSDRIEGNGGSDHIWGGGGNDTLHGDKGNDTMTGGAGEDYFVFDMALSATANKDRIHDFNRADDRILLDDDIFTAIGATGFLKAAAFTFGTMAKDTGDRIIHERATGKLFYDADGSGTGEKVQFAEVADNLMLTAADFYIIG